MKRLGKRIISTVSKNNILQSLNYRGGCAPPTSRGRDFFLLGPMSSFPMTYNNPYEMLKAPFPDIVHPTWRNKIGSLVEITWNEKSTEFHLFLLV